MEHIKSARQIAEELTEAMRRYSAERRQAIDKMKVHGDAAADGARQLISATGDFTIDLSVLLGDALDTIRLLAELEGRDELAAGQGMNLAEG